jgi:hypothetical protein
VLDGASPTFTLPGEIPVWRISNSGPATLVLRSPEDPAFAAPIPPKANEITVFTGDTAFNYMLELEPSGASANVQVCWPKG